MWWWLIDYLIFAGWIDKYKYELTSLESVIYVPYIHLMDWHFGGADEAEFESTKQFEYACSPLNVSSINVKEIQLKLF